MSRSRVVLLLRPRRQLDSMIAGVSAAGQDGRCLPTLQVLPGAAAKLPCSGAGPGTRSCNIPSQADSTSLIAHLS